MVTQDEHESPELGWNVEGEDLTFIRDVGLDLLTLYRKIDDEKKRQLILDLMRLFANEDVER